MVRCPAGLKERSPEANKVVILLTPTHACEIAPDPRLIHLMWRTRASQSALRVGSVEDETTDTLGMTDRIFNGDRATPARSHQRKLAEVCRLDHAFEITDPRF